MFTIVVMHIHNNHAIAQQTFLDMHIKNVFRARTMYYNLKPIEVNKKGKVFKL